MENPFPLPAALAARLGERLARVPLNRYPPQDPVWLKRKLSKAIGLPDGCGLMLGNGSDELIHIVIQACAFPGAAVLSPCPSFVRYATLAQLNGCAFVGVPLKADFAIDDPEMRLAIRTHRPVVAFVAWPNNPTGTLFDRDSVERMLEEASPGLVVLDEAYFPFARNTWLPQLARHDNLLVLRTFSKMGLAGIRFGYLCGRAEWLADLEKVRPPYNVNALTLEAVDLLLDHLDVFNGQAATIRAERDRLVRSLRRVPGLTVFPSAANFVLVRVADADAVYDGLREHGILVANVSSMDHQLNGCLRVTVGRPEENDAVLLALGATLSSEPRDG